MLYNSYKDVPKTKWHWPNFSPREMASKGDGSLLIYEPALDRLQALRTGLGVPLLITSAYRDPEHNKRVGGAKNSYHLKGMAFDVRMDNLDPQMFEVAAREAGFTGFGYYPRQGFMHIDIGPPRVWGTPFPRSMTNLPSEPPERQSRVQSRTLQASAADIMAKVAAGGTVLATMSGEAQLVVLGLLGVGVLLTIWIARERLKAWAEGWR